MLTVIAINSSHRKKHTHGLIIQIKKILENNNIHVEIINLFDYNIQTCLGCEHCLIKGGCLLKDDTLELMNKMKFADGIILTSPVYLENVSGKLKTFLDKTCSWFHRPEIYGKPVLVVATTKGSGLKFTLQYLKRVVMMWGAFYAGMIGRSIRNIDCEIKQSECDNFIKLLNMEKNNYKPTINNLIYFQVQKVLAYKLAGLDRDYWKEKGWNKEIYYFTCKIGFFKKLVATSFYQFLNKVINS